MPKSQIETSMSFDETNWVISVINTGAKFGGHAMMVVEGMNSQLFVGQYDIKAEIFADRGSFFNKIGRITEIRCYENKDYARDYTIYPHRSFLANAAGAQKMIDNIKAEAKRLLAGEIIPFQYLGTHHLFSFEDGGNNCASWCMEKLAIAGIVLKCTSKPKVVAAQTCALL